MAEKLDKEDIVCALVKKAGLRFGEANAMMDAYFSLIMRVLEEERYVKVKGLGIFKLIDVSDRKSVDVNTGKPIEIKGSRKVTFTPDAALKEAVNKPFAHFDPVELKEGVLSEQEITPDDEGAEQETDEKEDVQELEQLMEKTHNKSRFSFGLIVTLVVLAAVALAVLVLFPEVIGL